MMKSNEHQQVSHYILQRLMLQMISQRNRYSIRSSFGGSAERRSTTSYVVRICPKKRMMDIDPVLHSKSDSKLRCLTTKRKHNIDLRTTKSETLHLNTPFNYPNDMMKLDYIIKSFQSIEINDDENKNQYKKALKILS